MLLKNFILVGGLLTLLVGCGDVSSNRKMGENKKPEVNIPEVNPSTSATVTSGRHREKGSPILSYAEEISEISELIYRRVPDMEKDDEGSSLNVTTLSQIGRPTVVCGIADTLTGIDSRITECFQKNGNKALWESERYGASGEGNWKLISLDENQNETWLDVRSGMVWSEIKTDSNWCEASGNKQGSTPSATVNCQELNELVEADELCPETDKIKWRLPTRNDFLQADIDGARLVLKKETSKALWTATLVAGVTGRTQAWVYQSQNGTLLSDSLSNKNFVRCIGAPVR